eukprot:UN08119
MNMKFLVFVVMQVKIKRVKRRPRGTATLGEGIRDLVVEYMKGNYPTLQFDRSPEIKAKLEELRTQAQALAKDNKSSIC